MPKPALLLAFTSLFAAALLSGCTVKAKVERHVKRADAYFAKGDFERARIEYLNAFRLNQNDPHISARLGESLLERGDIQNGGGLLAHARDLQPTNAVVRAKLASLLLMAGNLKEARQEAEAILTNAPAYPDALVILANSASNTNEVAATRKRLESLRSSSPSEPAIYLGLGILSQKMGDLKAAEASFDQAVKLDPKSSKNNFALAAICFAQGDTNKADTYYKAAVQAAPVKSVERLAYADFLTKSGRVADAKSLLDEAVAKSPDFVAGWNALTQIAFAERNLDKASEYIGKALAHDSSNRDALLNQARLNLAKREFKTATDQLQKLAESHPRDSQVQYQLALAQLGSDDSAKALASLDKAISVNTNNVEAALLRAQIQISRGDLDNSIPELVRLARIYPKIPQTHYLLASAYRQRRATDDAIRVYEGMTRLFPKDPQPYQMIGAIDAQLKNFTAARKAYESALKINGDYLPAIDDLIELDILAKQYDAALARVDTYIKKYPDKPMPRLLQAKVFFAQQKNGEAEASVKKAIELDPEFYVAHRTLADFYIRSKQTDQAIAKLESMVKKNEKDVGSLVQLGMLYESKEDIKRARSTYEAVLKVNPSSTIALNNLAYILGEKDGDVDRAVQYARKAHDLAPYDPFSADTLGWMLWKKGDYNLALSSLQQAAQEFNTRGMAQPEVMYHLGMAYYMNGSTQPAIAALESAVQSTNTFNGKDKAGAALALLTIDPAKPTAASVGQLETAIKQNPSDVLAYTKLAQVYETHSEWDKARANYETALQKNPRSTLLLSRLASLYAGPLKNPARALELARQAWGVSQSADLAARLGPIGYAAGEFQWAYGLLLEAQRAQPDNAQLAFNFGVSAYVLGRIPQAEEALLKAAQSTTLDPRTSTLAKAAAQVIEVSLRKAPAASLPAPLAAAQKLDPNFPPVLAGSALLAERNNQFTAARDQYETALKTWPNFLFAQRQLVILLAEKLADDDRATQLRANLRRDFPDDPELTKALGTIAYRRNDYAEAARLLKLASTRLPKDADLAYYLGLSQYHLKEKDAKRSLTQAVSLDPGNKLAGDAKKALAELK